MRRILSFACVLGLAGCSGPEFIRGATLVVTPEPSQLVLTTSALQTATREADFPAIGIVVARYPRRTSGAITLRTYSIQYFDLTNTALPMTDVPQRPLPTPVTITPSAPDVPSESRFQLPILTPAIATYLKDQAPPVTINARVKFDGEQGPGEPLQFTFNVPIQVLASPASPAP